MQSQSQYRVCPPLASRHSVHRHLMELMGVWIVSCGIFAHSSWAASMSSLRFRGEGCLRETAGNWSQRCSIGDKSGDLAGQGNTIISLSSRKLIVVRAECGRALSCWKNFISGCASKNGRSTGSRISCTYRAAFKLPSTTTRGVRA